MSLDFTEIRRSISFSFVVFSCHITYNLIKYSWLIKKQIHINMDYLFECRRGE